MIGDTIKAILIVLMLAAMITVLIPQQAHGQQGAYTMLVECVEDYSQVGDPNLKYTCDGASTFINKIVSASNYNYFYWLFSDSSAWLKDWWTKEVSGYSYYPSYHAYRQDYAVFLGHGDGGVFDFGVRNNAVVNYGRSQVWLVSLGPYGYTWMYPHDDNNDNKYPLWITIYACNVLNNDKYPSGFNVFDVFYYTFSNQGRSPVYLHGIVGARTEMLDWYRACLICPEVDVVSRTMNDYADRLIAGASVVNAWFNAVWTQNAEREIFGRVVFQAHPVALYYIVQFKDSNGNVLQSIDYSAEGMLGFSSTIYPAPSQLSPPPGTATIVYIPVYLIG